MLAWLANLHTLNSERWASSFDFGLSELGGGRMGVYLLRGSTGLPSFWPPYAVLICTMFGWAATIWEACHLREIISPRKYHEIIQLL